MPEWTFIINQCHADGNEWFEWTLERNGHPIARSVNTFESDEEARKEIDAVHAINGALLRSNYIDFDDNDDMEDDEVFDEDLEDLSSFY